MHAVTGLLCGTAALCCLYGVAPQKEFGPIKTTEKEYTGRLGGWWVEASGRVAFELYGTDKDGKEVRLWFDTPADKDVNTLLENLVLDLVLHGSTKEMALSVIARSSSGDDGSEPSKAFDVVRVGFK